MKEAVRSAEPCDTLEAPVSLGGFEPLLRREGGVLVREMLITWKQSFGFWGVAVAGLGVFFVGIWFSKPPSLFVGSWFSKPPSQVFSSINGLVFDVGAMGSCLSNGMRRASYVMFCF